MIKIAGLFCGFLLLVQVCLGQDFGFKATIGRVPENSFYKIQVTPAITAHLQNNFSDLRLYDQKNQKVPYLLVREQPIQTRKLFRELAIVHKSIESGVRTTLILHSPHRSQINNISLVVKTASMRKAAQLSGSPDARHWFTIGDYYLLSPASGQAATAEVKISEFPPSDYEYYKLELSDSGTSPLPIFSAGYYDTQSQNAEYTSIPNFSLKQIDSSRVKRTYLKFSSPEPIIIDKLEFKVKALAFYHRRVTLFQKQQRRIRRRRIRETSEPVARFQLKPDNTCLLLAGLQTKDFYLEIENADSPPLEFESIQAYLLNTYLVADLKKGQEYYLQFGSPKVEAPSYDLQYFKNIILENTSVLFPQQVINLKKQEANKADSSQKSFFENNIIIWAAILLVIGFLAYMSYQMLKETGKNKL